MRVAILGPCVGTVEGIIAFEDLFRGRAYFRIITLTNDMFRHVSVL